jgi:hypothetical protein
MRSRGRLRCGRDSLGGSPRLGRGGKKIRVLLPSAAALGEGEDCKKVFCSESEEHLMAGMKRNEGG